MNGIEFAWFVVGIIVGVVAIVPAFIIHLNTCERRTKARS